MMRAENLIDILMEVGILQIRREAEPHMMQMMTMKMTKMMTMKMTKMMTIRMAAV